jgi:hypothetical protein
VPSLLELSHLRVVEILQRGMREACDLELFRLITDNTRRDDDGGSSIARSQSDNLVDYGCPRSDVENFVESVEK